MQLDALRYSEYENQPREWRMENVSFGPVTLLVGKNASGKSRTINVISGLAKLLRGEKPLFDSSNYVANFKDTAESFVYKLNLQSANVTAEEFQRGSEVLLKRGSNGVGQVTALKLKQSLEFQTEVDPESWTAGDGSTKQKRNCYPCPTNDASIVPR